ncbi:Zinc finger SWIM domain-containing protein 8 [Triplophysa tibetana]|uniref:Zinc finger SWIM domain-containing protein 8 n=1 Tax=Triplophysa tibetana TaxID=1572043 RepID=A0A5A9PAL6_9TELE|nr:Zinc finger SWIM domain-containing protein 8 [Triplophysa tibetana]
MELMFAEWEDGERFSFEDSDRFEEDSLCSFISEAESLCQNWRGWRKQSAGPNSPTVKIKDGQVIPLVELSAKQVAFHIPFEVVEKVYPPVPEQLQLRIAYWSFPENEEDIRLYSCLANGSPDEFQRGEQLYRVRAVKDPLQIDCVNERCCWTAFIHMGWAAQQHRRIIARGLTQPAHSPSRSLPALSLADYLNYSLAG